MENLRKLIDGQVLSLITKKEALEICNEFMVFAVYSNVSKGYFSYSVNEIIKPSTKPDSGKTIYAKSFNIFAYTKKEMERIPFITKEDFPFYSTEKELEDKIQELHGIFEEIEANHLLIELYTSKLDEQKEIQKALMEKFEKAKMYI